MKISYYGHACFMLEGSKIIIDPFLRNHRNKSLNIISRLHISSHGHGDHLGDGIKLPAVGGNHYCPQ